MSNAQEAQKVDTLFEGDLKEEKEIKNKGNGLTRGN